MRCTREVSGESRKEQSELKKGGVIGQRKEGGEVGELACSGGWHGASISRWKPLPSSN